MVKLKTAFFCQICGAKSPKWLGKCPSCQNWNTFVEEVIESSASNKKGSATPWDTSHKKSTKAVAKKLYDVESGKEQRYITPDDELNRTLGGGIVQGALILIGGEPGIGKSTLMLQLALQMNELKILYVSGEESERQVRMRAERIPYKNENLYILPETNVENIFVQIAELQPDMVIVDSVQTLHSMHIESAPGSITQVRECATQFMRFSKEQGVPVFLIGHITKDGSIAGPKVLEHMVDTVLQFEGDRNHAYRILRTSKNRFGSASEIGIYEMRSEGLRQVSNPSEVLLSDFDEHFSGIAIATILEGIRPMLIETQALVSTAVYATAQRSSTGFDLRRLNMLLAVLERRCGFRIGQKDVFLNITGGLRIEDPAADLGVVCAILSSLNDIPLPKKAVFCAEVGLSGEIRSISRLEQRLLEVEKMGFEEVYAAKHNLKGMNLNKFKLKIHAFNKLEEVVAHLFG